MSYESKTWKDRYVENPGRRTLSIVSQSASAMVVDVTRNEGEIDQVGDAFSATNMNDLEGRISDGFSDVDATLAAMNANFQAGCSTIAGAITEEGVPTAENATPEQMAANIATLATNEYNRGKSEGASHVVQVGALANETYNIDQILPEVYSTLSSDNFFVKLSGMSGRGSATGHFGSSSQMTPEQDFYQGCVSSSSSSSSGTWNTYSVSVTYTASTGKLKVSNRSKSFYKDNYNCMRMTVSSAIIGTIYCIY